LRSWQYAPVNFHPTEGSRVPAPATAEFVALAAAMMSTQALAVDAMLPGLPTIVGELHAGNANQGQWIVTVYIAGIGIGQLFWGLMSDRYGRRPILLSGLGLYMLAAAGCAAAGSFSALLGWRLLHGLAAAAMVVTRSVIRDCYSGRQMARILSLTFMVFLTIPVIAPSLGQLVLLVAPWRAVFGLFSVYGAVVWLWAILRLPETLHPEYRMTLTRAHIARAAKFVLGERTSLNYSLAVTVMFAALLAYVGMVQQIFAGVFHRAGLMPTMFALCAIAMGFAAFWNARNVERIGMRRISHAALLAFIAVSALHCAVAALGLERVWTFVLLQSAAMACFNLSSSNFGAMALEPIGAVAGIGAALQGFISTTGAALVAAMIGRQFNGSVMPLAAGALACGVLSLMCVLRAEHGRLFRAHHAAAAGNSIKAV
jgi:DHA1 family bicyclomycin/chloramphenicol resistance-like MFS transporter